MEFLHRMLRKRRCHSNATSSSSADSATIAPAPTTTTATTLAAITVAGQSLTHIEDFDDSSNSSGSSSSPSIEDEVAAFAEVVAFAVQTAATANDAAGLDSTCPRNVFDFPAAEYPSIGFAEYVGRAMEYLDRSTVETYLLALLYIDRVAEVSVADDSADTPPRRVLCCRSNYYRLFAAALTTAAKFYDESHRPNRYLARVFGVETAELNALEREFLTAIRFDLVADAAEFEAYRSAMSPIVTAVARGFSLEKLHMAAVPLHAGSPRPLRHSPRPSRRL